MEVNRKNLKREDGTGTRARLGFQCRLVNLYLAQSQVSVGTYTPGVTGSNPVPPTMPAPIESITWSGKLQLLCTGLCTNGWLHIAAVLRFGALHPGRLQQERNLFQRLTPDMRVRLRFLSADMSYLGLDD